jgi:V/A-type H+-transporting ATPase subunit I
MAITFPLFFGFMLGDIGYGLLVLLIAYLVARSNQKLRSFAEVLGLSALSAILFGAIFGEVFGLEAIGSFHLPSLLHRAQDPMTLGLIAIAFGVVHINLGLTFGLITEVREHGILHGFLRKGGWFLVQAGIAFLLFGQSWLWWSLALGLGVILLAWGEGVVGVVELPTIITHTLSYLRLAAIGLSGVFLAAVTNTVGGGMVMAGGWSIIGGLLILLIGHSVSLALGLFGSFLHSLRLHYAEFFMKFYEGGGKPYVAFGTPESAGVSG